MKNSEQKLISRINNYLLISLKIIALATIFFGILLLLGEPIEDTMSIWKLFGIKILALLLIGGGACLYSK